MLGKSAIALLCQWMTFYPNSQRVCHDDIWWLCGNILCHNTPGYRTQTRGIFSSSGRDRILSHFYIHNNKQNHPLTMSNAPKPVKRSHSKQRRKVNDDPLPIHTPCESLAANVNVVTQPTQECHHDDDEIAAITLLALSSSPGRPPGSSPASPFHSMVDSIVARANHQETSYPSTSIIEERVNNNLYALGLHSKRILPAIGNAPSLLFGSQVSPVMKRPHLDRQYLDPSRRLIFGEVEEVEVEVKIEIEEEEEEDTVTIPVTTVTSNFQRFNDNDRITSKNPDCIVVALCKLPIHVYPAKQMVPNPLISVQSSSLPLKQDMTKQSCANLVTVWIQ
jgi:hypothetical protein